MATLKMQLNTPQDFNRDMKVQLTHEATGREIAATPFLDGTIKLTNVPAGAYRVKVVHPNLTATLFDNRIRVFDQQPTFVPIKIPTDLFVDTPIKPAEEMDLGPLRSKAEAAVETADLQGKKKGGQPIYADDWNSLAGVVEDLSGAFVDLTRRVAPQGHSHPDLAAKMQEIQDNLEKFFDVFGRSLTELQRQIQQLALRQQVSDALDALGEPPETRATFNRAVDKLESARIDTPYAYTKEERRTGTELSQLLEQAIGRAEERDPTRPVRQDTFVNAAAVATQTMGAQAPALTYAAEMDGRNKREAQMQKQTKQTSVSTVLRK